MNINETIIKKHLSEKKFAGFPKDFLKVEKDIILNIFSGFCVSSAMNNTEIWKEIAALDSQQQISSDPMLVIGISKLMRGEISGLLWLRSNLSKFPTGRNLHAYFISLCQFVKNKEKIKPLLATMIPFIKVRYPDYLSFANSGFLTESFSVLPYIGKDLLLTLENTFRNVCMRDIFLNGCWTLEPELEWIETNLSNGDVLFDIGANAGIYTLCGARVVGKNGLIYSFEPNLTSINLIKRSIELNKLDNVILVPEAISDKKGIQDFVLYAASDHNHIKPLDIRQIVSKSTVIGTRKIKVTTLDKYFADKKLTRLDLIKIDVEGCEKFVLDGGVEIIKKFRPKLVLEINEKIFLPNGYNSKDLINTLKCMNYSVFRFCRNQLIKLDETKLENKGKSFNIIAIFKK